MTVTLDGQLEVDLDRGVIYFHNSKNGASTLRISGLRNYLGSHFDENTQIDMGLTTVERVVVGVTRLK
jgi:hypothetical protein